MTPKRSLLRFCLLLLFSAVLLSGCQMIGPAPLPRAERTDFSGGATHLLIDLPGRFAAKPESMPVPPEAAPFVRSVTRYQPKKEAGLSLSLAAVRFDEAAVARRFGAPATARQKFYADFQEALLTALLPEFQRKDAAREVKSTREIRSVNGRTMTVLSADYTSSLNTPGKLKAIFLPDERETWILTILYDVGDDKLPAEIERIIESIRMTG
ncbi:MAG: hypothetical protein ACTTJE_08125 [Schwartzia sp. (in: firmicutes)]